ncbi:1-propanol dehydrogenase PduQ [Caproiciproducens faecalis]|uniref:1-propanol dehydrogenase PduQ n=1 Tax=Caproiciproducens faecalis TaxID=2820301 RepID=UPI002106DF38|nr:1-propanol dehydrogenase PduQ [Caproiciproducens faecalis]
MDRIYLRTKIFYGENSLERLSSILGKRIWIICDRFLIENGSIRKVLEVIDNSNEVKLFNGVLPDTPLTVIGKGVAILKQFRPEVIIAFGGGSAIDTAKGILYFAREMKADAGIPLIAIPTTSGTGSEVTAATVVVDHETKKKHIFFDDSIYPDEAILDAKLTLSLPPEITANTGMDVLTHAMEAYVAKGASVYTDALAEKAVELIMKSLLQCYRHGDDGQAREQMLLASSLAGIAFSIAGLGMSHSVAHQVGGTFHIAHGLANAVLLNEVVLFNSRDSEVRAKYAQMAYRTGMVERSVDPGFAVDVLLTCIMSLKKMMNMPLTLAECGVSKEDFDKNVRYVAQNAVKDGCTPMNPIKITEQDVELLLKKLY